MKCKLILFIDVIGKCLHCTARDIAAGTEYQFFCKNSHIFMCIHFIKMAFYAVPARLSQISFTSEILFYEITQIDWKVSFN